MPPHKALYIKEILNILIKLHLIIPYFVQVFKYICQNMWNYDLSIKNNTNKDKWLKEIIIGLNSKFSSFRYLKKGSV